VASFSTSGLLPEGGTLRWFRRPPRLDVSAQCTTVISYFAYVLEVPGFVLTSAADLVLSHLKDTEDDMRQYISCVGLQGSL
jgi:hypothetical protein